MEDITLIYRWSLSEMCALSPFELSDWWARARRIADRRSGGGHG